jgi:hypothetical protein
MSRRVALLSAVLIVAAGGAPGLAAEPPTAEAAAAALRKAVGFYRDKVGVQGGYPWRTSGDLALREGEGICSPTQVWVQPPGTPAVGEVFLDAYDATGDPAYLDMARETGKALVRGQLRSGGWEYSIEFDPEKRLAHGYRDLPAKKKVRARSTLDDDTTQSAVRFLARLDAALGRRDPAIHDAARFGLDAILNAQYPNGGWYVFWDEYPTQPPSAEDFPVKKPSLPATWDRTWTKAYPGRYVLNDDLMPDMLDTLVRAGAVYDDPRCLEAIRRAGDFLVLAQLPDPQPAWAQQYDVAMQPCWARKFEPPAVTGGESQGVMETLLRIHQITGDPKYLEPIPRAIAYLKKSLLADGKLARFYEVNTNKALYFTKDDYQVTYSDARLPTHYGFKVESRLDRIEREYERQRQGPHVARGLTAARKPERWTPALAERAAAAIAAMDGRGAWVTPKGVLDAHDQTPPSGVIEGEAFLRNARLLAAYVAAARAREAEERRP